MNSVSRIFLTGVVVFLLSGCAGTAQPNFFNGMYYMSGDDSCRRVTAISDSRIMCYNENGEEMGYRDAMTAQQLSMYQHNQSMQQQQIISSQESVNRSIESINKGNERLMKQIRGY